jgi:hypothetical protein
MADMLSMERDVVDQRPVSEADGTDSWAICCSGGGIRSASYCLGALQWLEQAGFLKKAKLIVGVSGGGYIASSRALVAYGLEEDGVAADPVTMPPYAPGTPEEVHLRDNTRYLAPDAKTLLAGVLSLLFGVAVTLVLVLTPVFAVSHAWGWVLRSQGVLTYAAGPGSHTQQWTAALTGTSWWIWPVIAAGVTAVIFGWWWATLIPGPGGHERHSQVAVKALGWAAFVTLVLALAMLAVPALVAWLSSSHSGALQTVLNGLGFGAGIKWNPAAVTGFVAAVVAVSQSARKTLGKYNLLQGTAAAGTKGPATPASGSLATVTGYLSGLLLPWLASILVLLAFAVAGLRWVKDGAAAGFTQGQIWLFIGALAVMLVMRKLADVNRISLHDFYRWRLAAAYAVTRKTGQQTGEPAPFGTKARPGVRLSQLGRKQELVLCATANINAQREVPPGRGGLSFTFDRDFATLRGSVPSETVRARTADYEALVGHNRFALFDVSAISGAAFSPLMGSATRQALRILFTATDLRLGVWLPHPALVAAAAQELDRQEEQGERGIQWWQAVGLLLWYVLPHPFWRRRKDKLDGREARLWAHVLKLRRETSRSRQYFGGLMYHALQPTLGLLYAEAVTHTSYRGTWMCVTDGGHYDNLGLVEALHQGPPLGVTHILVLDASGDKANTWFTLGGSIALARSDAGVDIALNPTKMITPPKAGAPQLAQGQVVRPWVDGTFTRQDPSGAKLQGTLVVCKLGWWAGAPWDVRAYAAGHPAYPTDSTLEQLYDSAEFDAYRELGACSVQHALKEPARPARIATPLPRPAGE